MGNGYTSPCAPGFLTQSRMINILNPSSFKPRTDEIINSLSSIVRYNGHTCRPLTVAEHSLNCMLAAKEAPYYISAPHKLLFILLHDAAETYTQDIVRPLKRYAPKELIHLEEEILCNILNLIHWTSKQREEIDDPRFRKTVAEIDTRMCVTEIETLMPEHRNPIEGFEPLKFFIPKWPINFKDIRDQYRLNLMQMTAATMKEGA